MAKTIKTKPRQSPKSIGGWLQFFVITLGASIAWTLFDFFKTGSLSSEEIGSLNQHSTGLGTALHNLSALENLAVFGFIGLLVATIVLIVQRKAIARHIGAVALMFGAVYGVADYLALEYIYSNYDLARDQAFIDDYLRNVGRSILYAIIWVPYLFVSTRVKATLTRP